jgi:hypothetical protein
MKPKRRRRDSELHQSGDGNFGEVPGGVSEANRFEARVALKAPQPSPCKTIRTRLEFDIMQLKLFGRLTALFYLLAVSHPDVVAYGESSFSG